MAVVPRNSNVIANAIAKPKVLSNPSDGGNGDLKEAMGVVASAADDSATSVFRFCRVPSNARVSQVFLTAGTASSAGAVNVGLHDTAENGGAAVDADLFAAAQALTSSAAARGLDVTHQSGEYTILESVMPLWKVLGLAADPHKEYDVTVTVSTNFNGGPTSMAVKVRYVN